MPRWLLYVILVAVIASFVPIALIARARSVPSDAPRIQPVQDMGNQPKFKPQSENLLFADTRAMRPAIPGTEAHGGSVPDDAYETGKVNGQFVADVPVKVTEALIRRGQERFNIYCSPCHGFAGQGDGLVARRADQLQEGLWVPPTNLHTLQVRQRPNGHIFNTISRGLRTMPSYGAQIPVADRWAIVTYVRALQRSQHANPEDMPAEHRVPAGWQPAPENPPPPPAPVPTPGGAPAAPGTAPAAPAATTPTAPAPTATPVPPTK